VQVDDGPVGGILVYFTKLPNSFVMKDAPTSHEPRRPVKPVTAGRLLTASVVAVGLTAIVWATRSDRLALAEPAPAYELVALPQGLDTLTSLESAAAALAGCEGTCTSLFYVWTPRMPLSRLAIPNVESATRELGVGLTLLSFEELEGYAEDADALPSKLGDALLGAGALTHAPALVVRRGDAVVGPAILGYKSEEAYRSLIEGRLSGGTTARGPASEGLLATASDEPLDAVRFTDYEAVGVPGAYFRWVPGRRAVAYESNRRIYLLDLDDGVNRVAPGNIDFVPTPDGRFFVTPLSREAGLAFYDANEVFDAAGDGTSGAVRPFFSDPLMSDQYPSIGILSQDDRSIRYRILTSWFAGLVYRDYEVALGGNGARPTARPLGDPVVPCQGMALSTPIMSQDGLEVAAREEESGTTKIYAILPEGRCEEVLSLGMPTRKVAWHSSGRKLAFSTPRVRNMSGGGAEPGIFVYDRDEKRLTRLEDSNGASQLAFPDFVGDQAVVFMVPGRTNGEQSIFRVVEPIP